MHTYISRNSRKIAGKCTNFLLIMGQIALIFTYFGVLIIRTFGVAPLYNPNCVYVFLDFELIVIMHYGVSFGPNSVDTVAGCTFGCCHIATCPSGECGFEPRGGIGKTLILAVMDVSAAHLRRHVW